MLGGGITAVMLVIFFYGLIRYPDAPIKPCAVASGFCGKQNQARTLAEYEAFKRWETLLMICWPIGTVALIALGTRRRRD